MDKDIKGSVIGGAYAFFGYCLPPGGCESKTHHWREM